MNLRNWSKGHTYGLLLGILTTIVCVFIVLGFFTWQDGVPFHIQFDRFTFLNVQTAKVISLASIGNLVWFHTFLKKEKWTLAMGVILATVINLIVILYFKFI